MYTDTQNNVLTITFELHVWILYGLHVVHPDSTLVITINAVGLALELIYLSIFCLYDCQKSGRKVVGLGPLREVIFVGVIDVITFLAFHTHSSRIVYDIFNVIMCTSPLTIWVYKTSRTQSITYKRDYKKAYKCLSCLL
ncbi:hypothetical protein CICLE_v10006758mg [Citrus x clementina]|uniref:Bidirectional sugar transporter SWEET n=1 Tax=Citrus clementina TaxID=85681 RepID=V4TZR4_CITCL|nr:hypothetical protein CICLE_v10006758mg [Citrus x clementina]